MEMEPSQTDKVLQQDIAPRLEKIILDICSLKLDHDRNSRKILGQPYIDDWMGSFNTCSYGGDSFLRLIVPFLLWEEEESEPYKAYVDPRYVLGSSVNGFPESIKEDDIAARIEKYSSKFGSTDNVYYCWFRRLGVFSAIEGKHRVAFMRHHNQPAIAAWVSEKQYPDPSRLLIIEPDREDDDWFCLLDGRYLQLLRRPQVSKLILNAYGVEVARWDNVPELPNKEAVRSIVYKKRFHHPPSSRKESDRTLDLQSIKTQLEEDNEIVQRKVYELEPLRLQWSRIVKNALISSAIGGMFLLTGIDILKEIGLMFVGGALGLITSMELITLTGPRRAEIYKRKPLSQSKNTRPG
ncbi:hypothetical protein [Chromohalobacter israelensis]|uniref:hypothetical protein n=1 Tax=Chromohalobacter israelensis TaxID=141390 RepID=UPI0012EB08EB|nr:hypothetical protein [Chromohalobacter israelensis]MDF9434617.1 hypothetical protein [Chromohalobacter israelensis]